MRTMTKCTIFAVMIISCSAMVSITHAQPLLTDAQKAARRAAEQAKPKRYFSCREPNITNPDERLDICREIPPPIGSPEAKTYLSSNRVYQLCRMEDPSCIDLLRGLYKKAVAWRAAHGCDLQPSLGDEEIFGHFMQIYGQSDGMVRELSGLDAMHYVLGFVAYCQR